MKNILIIFLFISFTAKAADSTFITSASLGDVKNNYTGFVGCKITIKSSPITITQLGRWATAGNNKVHTLKITNQSGVTVVQGSVDVTGKTGFVFVAVTPTTLLANTIYYVLSSEQIGGDTWRNPGNPIYYPVATINVAALCSVTNVLTNVVGEEGQTYGPVNFKYNTGVVPPVIPPVVPPVIPPVVPPVGNILDFLKTLPGYTPYGTKVLFSDFTWRVPPSSTPGVFYLKPPLYPVNDSTAGYKP